MTFETEHHTCCQVFYVINNIPHHIHSAFCREIRNADRGAKRPQHGGSCINTNFFETKFKDASKLLVFYRDRLYFFKLQLLLNDHCKVD